jgi:hypothetical protein
MAIGDTVNAGLMRVDFSPFLEAGRANAAANASFGQALGTIAKGYIEGQEKKARSEEMTGYLMNQGVGEKDAKAISKNPFLQKEYQRKQASEAQMKMEEKRLASQANIASAGRAQRQAELDEGYRRQDAVKAETNAFYDRLNDLAPTDELTPGAQQRIDSFSSTTAPNDPRRLAQVNDPQAFMERVKNDPSSYVQKPVYELEGLDFYKQFEDPGMFQKALAFQQANQPKAPDPFEAKKYYDESINKIRKEYNSLDEVKAFKPVRASFLKVKKSAEKPSAAGDLALVFNYMKILDPGSVVRESEFKTASDATAWLQKNEADGVAIPAPIAQAIRKLKDGTILTDTQRKDFVNIARKAASAQFAPVKDSYLQYKNIVGQMQLPEDLTLPDNYKIIEDELAGQIPIESSSNAITTDQGNYTIPGQLSVEAQ